MQRSVGCVAFVNEYFLPKPAPQALRSSSLSINITWKTSCNPAPCGSTPSRLRAGKIIHAPIIFLTYQCGGANGREREREREREIARQQQQQRYQHQLGRTKVPLVKNKTIQEVLKRVNFTTRMKMVGCLLASPASPFPTVPRA